MKITRKQIRRVIQEAIYDWPGPMNLPSGYDLEGNQEIGAYHDQVAAQKVLPELEEYMEYNYRASLEDAVEAWLEDHFHGISNSPDVIEAQREFLMKVGRDRGLDKI